jgi:hypothetical protein
VKGLAALRSRVGAMTTIATGITALRSRVGTLATRAVRGEDLLTGAITDANENVNVAATHYANGDIEAAREALQLAQEQLDAAEQRPS